MCQKCYRSSNAPNASADQSLDDSIYHLFGTPSDTLNQSGAEQNVSLSNAAFSAQSSHEVSLKQPETPPESIGEMYEMFLQMKSYFTKCIAEKDRTIASLTERVVSLEKSVKKVASAPANGTASVNETVFTEMKKEYSDNFNTIKATVAAQQKTLEDLQQEKRAKNVVITGVTEPTNGTLFEMRKKDEATVESIFAAVECPGVTACRVTRIGRRLDGNSTPRNDAAPESSPPPRPLLVTFNSAADARAVTSSGHKLKQNNVFEKVYLKKDEHPLIRKEWNRLRIFARKEKAAPINIGCTIKVDYKKKAVTRDGVTILEFVSPFRTAGPSQ